MKKIIMIACAFIVVLFAAKIFAVGVVMQRAGDSGFSFWAVNPALADSHLQGKEKAPVRDVFEDTLMSERNLAASLDERRKNIEDRENSVRSEAKRVASLKEEIDQKMKTLRHLEDKSMIHKEGDTKEDIQHYKELARVYEAAPPERVGALLDKIDNKTAAGIILQMKKKKAGAVLEHVSPEKVVEIAGIITGS